jgi:hypothetical protein
MGESASAIQSMVDLPCLGRSPSLTVVSWPVHQRQCRHVRLLPLLDEPGRRGQGSWFAAARAAAMSLIRIIR